MHPFNFDLAQSESAAISSHAKSQSSRFIAGGTTLVDLMKLEVERPDLLVDINALPLKSIRESGGAVLIGALVSNSDLANHNLIKKNFPVLSEAVLSGASPQLRNLATVSGNLLQRTRCAYFRDNAFACNKRVPGSGCAAMNGENRMHAVLGGSASCIASHPSDMCVAMAALGAKVHLLSATGSRVVSFSEFYRLPGTTAHIETSMAADELITAVEIPRESWFTKSTYVKIRDRASYAFALTSAAVALDVHGGQIRNARVALGGVGTIPWRAFEAETALQGKSFSPETLQAAASAALNGAQSRGHNAFKISLAQKTLVRALNQVGGQS